MSRRVSFYLAAVILVAATIPAMAQGPRFKLPNIRGIWNPVIGGGAVYEDAVPDGGNKKVIQATIVGKEDVNGTTGYWLEFGTEVNSQPTWMQMLMVLNGNQIHAEKAIVQMNGMGPLEIPSTMMGSQATQKAVLDDASRVGNESVTTAAGTFDCEHWKANDGSYDTWISKQVMPFGLVKHVEKSGTTTLVKLVSDGKTHITGTPQKFDPSMFGRRGN